MTPRGEPLADGHQPLSPRGPAGTGERIRLLALVTLTAVLIGLCLLLAAPFLPAITWAVALAILAWPMHRWIAHRASRRGVAAALSSAVVAAAILATGLFVAYQIASETVSAAGRMKDGAAGGDIREKTASIPVLGKLVAWMERVGLDVEATARGLVESNIRGTTNLAQGSAMAIIQFLVAMFILYYLFRDRDTFLGGLRDLLPLSRAESDFLFARAADSVHATLYATVVTSIIDATAFGLTFWATGLPAPVLWAVIMFILSLLPVLGAGLVWVPAAAYLAMTGRWLGAAALIGLGVVTATFVDNILYARLAGGRMRMHNVPVLVSFLGGIAAFGMSGMILGPAILAVTEAILEVWKRRLAGHDRPPASRTPAGYPARARRIGVTCWRSPRRSWRSGSGGWAARRPTQRLGHSRGLRAPARRIGVTWGCHTAAIPGDGSASGAPPPRFRALCYANDPPGSSEPEGLAPTDWITRISSSLLHRAVRNPAAALWPPPWSDRATLPT